MNPAILSQFGLPDPNANPLNLTETVLVLNTLLTSELQGDYIPYLLSANTPSVDDQDKAWIELDGSGRPLSIKTFYNGNWRRVYNGMIGEVRMYSGDPTIDFDTNGLGNVGGRFDGWHICNGKDGTINLTDKFVVGAHMDDSGGHVGYNSGWQTFVDGISDLKTGGVPNQMIVAANLPPIDTADQSAKLVLHGFEAKDGTSHADAVPIVDVNYAGAKPHDYPIANYGAGPNDVPGVPQVAMPTLPPFFALAFVTFVGYA